MVKVIPIFHVDIYILNAKYHSMKHTINERKRTAVQ